MFVYPEGHTKWQRSVNHVSSSCMATTIFGYIDLHWDLHYIDQNLLVLSRWYMFCQLSPSNLYLLSMLYPLVLVHVIINSHETIAYCTKKKVIYHSDLINWDCSFSLKKTTSRNYHFSEIRMVNYFEDGLDSWESILRCSTLDGFFPDSPFQYMLFWKLMLLISMHCIWVSSL